jgi:hypothetical protein
VDGATVKDGRPRRPGRANWSAVWNDKRTRQSGTQRDESVVVDRKLGCALLDHQAVGFRALVLEVLEQSVVPEKSCLTEGVQVGRRDVVLGIPLFAQLGVVTTDVGVVLWVKCQRTEYVTNNVQPIDGKAGELVEPRITEQDEFVEVARVVIDNVGWSDPPAEPQDLMKGSGRLVPLHQLEADKLSTLQAVDLEHTRTVDAWLPERLVAVMSRSDE